MDEMQEINMEFVDESVEVLNNVMDSVMGLNSETDCESINNIFRAFHSMKGNARMLGFDRLGAFGHKAEDALSLIRNGDIEVDRTIVDILLHVLDMMILILEDIRDGAGDGRDTATAIASLENIISSAGKSQKPAPATSEIRPETTRQQATPHREEQPAKPLSDTPFIKELGVAAPVAAAAKGNAAGGIVFDLAEEPPAALLAPQPMRSEPGSLPISATGSTRHPAGSPLKILIAEDDFTSRTILTQFLSEYGDCHIAKDGLEAIQAVTLAYGLNPPQPYDLICMDIMMPNIDGAVAAKTIREIERSKGVAGPECEAAIVFTSAVSDPATIIKACYECGANYYFVKPLDFKQMKRQLKKLNLIR